VPRSRVAVGIGSAQTRKSGVSNAAAIARFALRVNCAGLSEAAEVRAVGDDVEPAVARTPRAMWRAACGTLLGSR